MARALRSRKKKTRRSYKPRVPRLMAKGMPVDKVMATFVYSGQASIDQTAFSAAYGQIQCNSLFDPEITLQWRSNISGQRNAQPRYRDQVLGVLYRKYSVLNSTAELTFQSTSANANDLARCYIYTIANGDGGGDSRPAIPGLIEEHPWVKKNGQVKDLGLIRGSRSRAVIKAKWNLSDADRSDKINNEVEYGNAPDVFVPYFQFGVVNASATTGSSTDLKMYYTVTFNVLLSDPAYQNTS